jgi:hypothetical protein
MEDTHVLNSILACIFLIVYGVFYFILFIALIIYRGYATTNIPVRGKLPPAAQHGIDVMEEQPFLNIRTKTKKKKKESKRKNKKEKAAPLELQT